MQENTIAQIHLTEKMAMIIKNLATGFSFFAWQNLDH